MEGRRFANAVLVAGAVLALSGGIVALRNGPGYETPGLRRVLLAAAPMVVALGLLATLRLSTRWRVNLALCGLSLVVSAYAAEYVLMGLPEWRTRRLASRSGVVYDPRTTLEVVRDLRRTGIDAWPSVSADFLVGGRDEPGLLPLGGISRVVTVLCNEIGSYLVYPSDEHGFHNPPGLWSAGPLEIATLGDSYTHGRCVPSDQNMVALIRGRYPRTLNLGMSGDGLFGELATLQEYLPELRPRRVLWFYFEGNDLFHDLERDRRHPLLPRYLEPGFRQGLAARQAEIDALIRRQVEAEFWTAEARILRDRSAHRWEGLPRLRTLRASLGFALTTPRPDASRLDYGLVRTVLAEARDRARRWGGRLYFVYIPERLRYGSLALRQFHDAVRVKVLAIVRDLDVAVIDLVDVFGSQANVMESFAPTGGHFTPRGNVLAAEAVLAALDDRDRPGHTP